MLIADVLNRKGAEVTTAAPATTVSVLLALLAEKHIGAVVVSGPDGSVEGIVSERDVVLQLHARGAELLTAEVSELMTREVQHCSPGDSVDGVLATMTEHRVRHVPVIKDSALVGIVSIGDLVKSRIDELQVERDQLTAYISS